jgi:hypothetical protein
MALNADTLKADLKTDLLSVFAACDAGSGISAEDYADRIAGVIASRVVKHITGNAKVTTTVTGSAGPYGVTGSGSGTVS